MDIDPRLSQIKHDLQRITQAISDLQTKLNTSSPESINQHQKSLLAIAHYLALSPSMDKNEVLQMTLRCAMHVVGAGGAGLTLFDSKKQKLVFKAAIGDGSEGILGYEVPLKGSQHGLAFATGEVQSATPIHSDIEKTTKATFRNVLVAPLLVDDEGIGTMSAVNKMNGDHFTPTDMEAYQLLADLAALMIQQHQRGQIIEQLLQGQDSLPEELRKISLSENDRLLLKTIQQLITLAHQKPDQMSVCSKIIDNLLC